MQYRPSSVTPTPSSMVVRVTMDLFQHRYYRLSKTLMTLIGQWPYQNTHVKRVFLAGLIVFIASIFVASLLALAKYHNDPKMLLECIFLYVCGAICVAKLLGFIVHSQKTLKLTNRIRTDWQVWARDREVNILHGYAEQGAKITILYLDLSMLRTATMYSILFVFVTQPVIPKIIDVLLRNGTECGQFPLPMVYYHVDEQKYYFYLIAYSNVCICLIVTLLISSDAMLIMYVQHVCGLLAALGHKLERIGNNEGSVETDESSDARNKRDMVHLASCIDRHNDAIKYANIVEASYTRTFFITAALGMVLINTTGLQVLMRTSDPAATARFILCVLAIMFYFYLECYFSQTLIDHSISIRFHIYNSQWYRLSPKAQKILQFMTMRSTSPCHLTAGKMMILSARTFWLTLKTTISYFAFVRSTQGL